MRNDEATARYATAKGYVECCKMICLSPHYQRNALLSILPTHMLAAFSLELFFKAWLLKAGLPSMDVRKLGHDLNGLYAAAISKGLPHIANLEGLKDHFAGPHSDFTYRYISGAETLIIKDWNQTFKIIDDLDFQVDRFIGASATFGLSPGH